MGLIPHSLLRTMRLNGSPTQSHLSKTTSGSILQWEPSFTYDAMEVTKNVS